MRNSSFNSRPHKEVDIYVIRSRTGVRSFNSRPHKEVDPVAHGMQNRGGSFNSRPHKEVDRQFVDVVSSTLSFQFTTSQGGRLDNSDNYKETLFPFNSRPHKEVDGFSEKQTKAKKAFQFTTSQGGRPLIDLEDGGGTILSIHDLTRRSTQRR